jgi:hypothetical protein
LIPPAPQSVTIAPAVSTQNSSGPPTSTGATLGGIAGISANNHATCQAIDAAGNHTAPTALSAAVVTILANQTIPWTCPVPSGTPPASYLFAFCAGVACTPAYYTTSGSNTFTQSAAASTYTSGTLATGNTTGGLDPTHGGAAVCWTGSGNVCNSEYGIVEVTWGAAPADGDLFSVGFVTAKGSLPSIIAVAQYSATISSPTSGCNAGQAAPQDLDTSNTTSAVVYLPSSGDGFVSGNTCLFSYHIDPELP